MPVRLVIDPEVFIKAIRSPQSASRRLLEAVEDGQATLLINPDVFQEYRHRLPRELPGDDEQRLSRSWISRSQTVTGDARCITGPVPNDQFAALAVAGKAHALVCCQPQRLALGNRIDVPVVKPDEALKLIGARGHVLRNHNAGNAS